jgi:hypothetical protein
MVIILQTKQLIETILKIQNKWQILEFYFSFLLFYEVYLLGSKRKKKRNTNASSFFTVIFIHRLSLCLPESCLKLEKNRSGFLSLADLII